MAGTIRITCPECDKTLTAPAAVAGKKVRCKACGHAFVAQAAAAKPAAAPAASAKPPQDKPAARAVPAPAKPPQVDDDEESNSDPYRVSEDVHEKLCPYCARPMTSEDAIICLECGYNTMTRLRTETKKIYNTTGLDWFLWLAPGILAVIFVIATAVFDVLYMIYSKEWFGDGQDFYVYMWDALAIKLWTLVMTVFLMYYAARFAIRRLIFNPRPPEYEKKK
jgi:hypothetical protein